MPVLLLACIFFSIIINTFNLGFFSFASFGILILLYFLLFFIFFRFDLFNSLYTSKLFDQNHIISASALLLVITYALFMYFYGGIYQENAVTSIMLMIIPVLLFPIILTFLPVLRREPWVSPWFYGLGRVIRRSFSEGGLLRRMLLNHNIDNKSQQLLRFWFLFCGAIFMRILMIISSPRPIIDVFTQLKEGPLALLSGHNPYSAVFSQVYTGVISDYYNYWPVSLLLELPFVAVFRDPRVLLIIADMFNALLLIMIGKRKPVAYILSLVYLFRPNSNFVIEQSFLSSLELFFLFLSFYILEKKTSAKDYILGFVLGLLTGIKQIYIGAVLFFMILGTNLGKFIAGFLTVIIFIILPFVIWDTGAFRADTIDFFLNIHTGKPNIPIHQSLNMNTLYYLFTGKDISFIVSVFFLLLFLFIYLFRLNIFMRNKTINARNRDIFILLGIILFYMTFYIFLSHAFINYYFVISGLVILLSVKMLTKEKI